MSIQKTYNKIKKQISKPASHHKIKEVKFFLKHFKKFLSGIENFSLLESILKGFSNTMIKEEIKKLLFELKANKVNARQIKKALQSQCYKATQGARILFMPLQSPDTKA